MLGPLDVSSVRQGTEVLVSPRSAKGAGRRGAADSLMLDFGEVGTGPAESLGMRARSCWDRCDDFPDIRDQSDEESGLEGSSGILWIRLRRGRKQSGGVYVRVDGYS
ncbi:hypothetical protein JTE90_006608 [Oedothorax gibbosus]|uniref:Uncharacterized protein n=1 Tax=Oedothorax gibbosus TaxID=931172 RepID=A0AAV6U6M6_9ARAC|nr:hypothetical protein JTE90_006608 [Oedothorax gibbosus]